MFANFTSRHRGMAVWWVKKAWAALTKAGYTLKFFAFYGHGMICWFSVSDGGIPLLCLSLLWFLLSGVDSYYDKVKDMIGYYPSCYMKYCWKFITPLVSGVSMLQNNNRQFTQPLLYIWQFLCFCRCYWSFLWSSSELWSMTTPTITPGGDMPSGYFLPFFRFCQSLCFPSMPLQKPQEVWKR